MFMLQCTKPMPLQRWHSREYFIAREASTNSIALPPFLCNVYRKSCGCTYPGKEQYNKHYTTGVLPPPPHMTTAMHDNKYGYTTATTSPPPLPPPLFLFLQLLLQVCLPSSQLPAAACVGAASRPFIARSYCSSPCLQSFLAYNVRAFIHIQSG